MRRVNYIFSLDFRNVFSIGILESYSLILCEHFCKQDKLNLIVYANTSPIFFFLERKSKKRHLEIEYSVLTFTQADYQGSMYLV